MGIMPVGREISDLVKHCFTSHKWAANRALTRNEDATVLP